MSEAKQLSMFDAVEIPLTKGYVALIDPCDADLLKYKWFPLIEKNNSTVYVTRNSPTVNGKRRSIAMHRDVMSLMLGRPLLSGEYVDHIDRNGLNNRRGNLRVATHSQNICNSKLSVYNTSGFKGVVWNKQCSRWQAWIKVNKKQTHVGYFTDPVLAARAYDAAALKYYGEFARTNVMLGLLPPLD